MSLAARGVPPSDESALLRFAGRAGSRLLSTPAFLLAARLLGAAAGFLVQLILAKSLSPENLGVYFGATSLAVIGGVLAAHGYPSIATRFASRYRPPRSRSLLRAFVRRAQSETLVLALTIAAIVATAAAAWPGIPADTRIAVAVAAFTIPFVACFRLYGSLAAATRAFCLAYLPDVCLKPILLLGALGAIFLIERDVSLVQVMIALGLATVVLSSAQYALLAKQFPVALTLFDGSPRRPAAPRALASKWRREAHTVLLVAVFSQFFPELSVLIASPVLSASDMGAFGLCLKLAFLVGFFVLLTQNMATPDLADALGQRADRRAPTTIAASAFAATIATSAALLMSFLWGEQALGLFGRNFEAGHTALVLLVAAQLVRAAFGPTNTVLTLVGEQKANLQLTLLAIGVLAVSTAILGNLFGLDGAALAVLITMLFWSAASAYVLHRKAGVRVDVFSGRASG